MIANSLKGLNQLARMIEGWWAVCFSGDNQVILCQSQNTSNLAHQTVKFMRLFIELAFHAGWNGATKKSFQEIQEWTNVSDEKAHIRKIWVLDLALLLTMLLWQVISLLIDSFQC